MIKSSLSESIRADIDFKLDLAEPVNNSANSDIEEEEGAKYLFRKVSQVNNSEIKISPFIPDVTLRRWSSFNHLSYLLQQQKFTTRIRETQSDYLLLAIPEGDTIKWRNAPAVIMPETLPRFQVGKFSTEDEKIMHLKKVGSMKATQRVKKRL